MPTIVQLEWEIPPSSDTNEFWFPYWVKVGSRTKYGQFAPMIGKNADVAFVEIPDEVGRIVC